MATKVFPHQIRASKEGYSSLVYELQQYYVKPEGGISEDDLAQTVKDRFIEKVSTKADLPATGVEGRAYIVLSDETNQYKSTLYIFRNSIYELLSGGSSSTTSGGLSQITKLGVVAPYDVQLVIPSTTDFNRPPIEVLKFTPAEQNVIQTICAFDNADATSFQADVQVVFDGTMHLKTLYQENMVDEGALGSGKLWTKVIDKTQFKSIEKVELV